jgi:hypothetical protein
MVDTTPSARAPEGSNESASTMAARQSQIRGRGIDK